MLSTSLQSSCRGNQTPAFPLWHHHNQRNVCGINALIYIVRRYRSILAPTHKMASTSLNLSVLKILNPEGKGDLPGFQIRSEHLPTN